MGIADNSPAPWIVNMQRFGPPPSYPHLRIPGLNTAFMDPQYNFYLKQAAKDEEVGKIIGSIYGDVGTVLQEEDVDKSLWGITKDIEYEEGEDYDSDAGIENEIAKNTEIYDLSHHLAGAATTNYTSGIEYVSHLNLELLQVSLRIKIKKNYRQIDMMTMKEISKKVIGHSIKRLNKVILKKRVDPNSLHPEIANFCL